jgi:HEAT repeat
MSHASFVRCAPTPTQDLRTTLSYAHSVILLVKWLVFGVLSIDLSLVAYILYRRASRNRFFAQKDAAQNRFSSTITDFFAGNIALGTAIQALKARNTAEREAIKTLVLARITKATRQQATALLFALGFAQRWAEQAFGKRRAQQLLQQVSEDQSSRRAPRSRNSLAERLRRTRALSISRAVAVGYLGRLAPEFSTQFMAEALQDPSPYVGRLIVAAMGRNPIPNGVPMLLEELRRSVAGETELPVRCIRTALVRYPIEDLRHYLGFVDHPSQRFRFLAVDTIREICRKAQASGLPQEHFPAELRRWFLHKAIQDEAADVRARSAAVISFFRDAEAVQALRILLADDNEFVRLHSLRACVHPYYAELLPDILRHMTDRRWRVREAAVRTLAAFGPQGRKQLEQFFLDTSDRYASEQVGDELQRSGVFFQVVEAMGSADGERHQATAVCSKMIRLGMDSLAIEILAKDGLPEIRAQLMQLLGESKAPQLGAVLQRIASKETGQLGQQAGVLLRRQAKAAAAGGHA